MSIKNSFDADDDANLITGIHNYCDRWCERCSFTARCAVYAAEQADPSLDPAGHDINNVAFWQKISAIFAETRAPATIRTQTTVLRLFSGTSFSSL